MDTKRFLIRWAARDLRMLEDALAFAPADDVERLQGLVDAARAYAVALWKK